VAEEALSKIYETINAFPALFHNVFPQIKGIGYYLVILAMFLCHYAMIHTIGLIPCKEKASILAHPLPPQIIGRGSRSA
jgi:hypothetical protein